MHPPRAVECKQNEFCYPRPGWAKSQAGARPRQNGGKTRVRERNGEARPMISLTIPTATVEGRAETEIDAVELEPAVRFRQDQRGAAETGNKKKM